jgi:hypothetical protein
MFEQSAGPHEIYRRDLRRTALVYGVVAEGESSAEVTRRVRDEVVPALTNAYPDLAASVR